MSLFGAVALSLAAAPALAATATVRPDSTWVRLGVLPERLDSPIFALAVSPTDPGTVLVGTGSGSIYRSADGGASWTPAAHGLRGVETIQFSPFKAGLVYAGTRSLGLWRSTDNGATWSRQPTIPNTTVRSLGFAKTITLAGSDGGLYSTRDGLTWALYPMLNPLSLSALAVPVVNDPPRFLAGADSTKGDEALPLYLSPDAGATWTNVKSLGSSTMIATAAAGSVPPQGTTRPLLVGTNVGAFASADGGATWGQLAGLPAIDFTSISFLANHPERIYVASDGGGTESGGVWTSSDSGQSFRSLASPVGSVTAITLTAEDQPTLYAATFRPADHAVMLFSFRDIGGSPNPPIGGIPGPPSAVAATTAAPPAAAGIDWRRMATGPEAPYLALGLGALFISFLALVLQVRRGRD